MNKEEAKFMIIQSLGVNYPIIRTISEVEKPIMLVMDRGMMEEAIKKLTYSRCRLSEYMSTKNLDEVFTNKNSEYAVYAYPEKETRQSLDFLNKLLCIFRTKQTLRSACRINVLPIVVAEKIPLEVDLDNFLVVFCDKVSRYNIDDLVPDDKYIPVLLEQMNDINANRTETEEVALINAALMIYHLCQGDDKEESFNMLTSTARKMLIDDDNNKDLNNIGDGFIRTIYTWAEDQNFSSIFNLSELPDVIDIKNSIFEDDKYLYIKDALLKSMVERMLSILSIDALKKQLKAEKIIVVDNANTYTTKVGYIDNEGNYKRERFIKLDKARIRMPGTIGFADLCELRKEKIYGAGTRNQ